MKVKQILFILAFLFAGTISIITPAEAVILMPDVDGDITDFEKDGIVDNISQGGSLFILNQAAFGLYGGTEIRGILEFDISGLSGPVSSSVLDLETYYFLNPNGFPLTLGFYSYTGDGAISGSDYGAGTLIDLYDYNGESNILLDVSVPLQSFIDNGENFMGFNLRMESVPALGTTTPNILALNSLEYPLEQPRPGFLNVGSRAVPEPASLFLIGAGLMGLVSGRKRKI